MHHKSVCCPHLCLPHSKIAGHVDMTLCADMDVGMSKNMVEMAVCYHDEGVKVDMMEDNDDSQWQ